MTGKATRVEGQRGQGGDVLLSSVEQINFDSLETLVLFQRTKDEFYG